MSSRCLRDNLITTGYISCCVILFSVYFVCSIPILHCLLISSGDNDKWRPLDWNVFDCGIYSNSIPTWDTFLGIDRTFRLAVNLCDRVKISYMD